MLSGPRQRGPFLMWLSVKLISKSVFWFSLTFSLGIYICGCLFLFAPISRQVPIRYQEKVRHFLSATDMAKGPSRLY
jgi:hypothetical protein